VSSCQPTKTTDLSTEAPDGWLDRVPSDAEADAEAEAAAGESNYE